MEHEVASGLAAAAAVVIAGKAVGALSRFVFQPLLWPFVSDLAALGEKGDEQTQTQGGRGWALGSEGHSLQKRSWGAAAAADAAAAGSSSVPPADSSSLRGSSPNLLLRRCFAKQLPQRLPILL